MPGIFLSYRRSEATAWAGLLQRSLEQRLPDVHIFRDIDNIPSGVKFADHIGQAVGSCDVLIALIGPTWLTSTDEDGVRRIDDEADFVRLEISTAIARKVPIVPALVDGATMPKRTALPEPLREMVDWQNQELPVRLWEESCDRLAASLRPFFRGPKITPPELSSTRAAELIQQLSAPAESKSRMWILWVASLVLYSVLSALSGSPLHLLFATVGILFGLAAWRGYLRKWKACLSISILLLVSIGMQATPLAIVQAPILAVFAFLAWYYRRQERLAAT